MRRGRLSRVAVAVAATVALAAGLASASALLVVRFIPCAAMLGSSGPCNGFFGGWPFAFAPYGQGNQLAERMPVLFFAFAVDVALWAVPAALIVAVLWPLCAAVRRARRSRAR